MQLMTRDILFATPFVTQCFPGLSDLVFSNFAIPRTTRASANSHDSDEKIANNNNGTVKAPGAFEKGRKISHVDCGPERVALPTPVEVLPTAYSDPGSLSLCLSLSLSLSLSHTYTYTHSTRMWGTTRRSFLGCIEFIRRIRVNPRQCEGDEDSVTGDTRAL
jgi:hypothetical protein